ncbi:methylenetetrahydrofolate reductase-like protein [Trichodelitschia bisporula]|uniref:Methylenetetrahydrofolate reductase-like protein n=1 Tax=Trichodelitschia bisporula TaxID=703511 RepID=A0A6G1I5E5_9PEZI|nr:methylenetetrahydrofolate reductase-like protein [Trichodelitschia bisporula]
MHISDKLADASNGGKPTFSFEFFPAKTAQGIQNLYDRMDRMHGFGPSYIDITWGAGGRSAHLTCEMVHTAQTALGLETCMHLTCTDMPKSKIDDALKEAYNSGCTNILALRGDPPREKEQWEATSGGFRYAKDLVTYIRDAYGDHFDIGVAGYSERCEDNEDVDELVDHLKEKVDAGATFVVTQMFYDADIFLDWVRKCRAKGITVPIIPGIMPISTYAAFIRRANGPMRCKIPDSWMAALEPVKNNDVEVREIGKNLVVELCRKLLDSGLIHHLHFYTMNLAQATRMVLQDLGLLPDIEAPLEKPLPWRQSLGLRRKDENVRPIFWRNRGRSYVARTQEWDEFPNGRWGDSRSPAFGELDAYGVGLQGSNEHYVKLWGTPTSVKDVSNLFIKYMQGKVDSLPWSDQPISLEAGDIKDKLIALNERGLLTINSQPAVDGAKSSDPVHGWGPRGGYVYQKAYLEVLISSELIAELITRIERDPDLTYYAVNKAGDLKTNAPGDGPNAVTWGVFPGKEIIQPTIVETISFLAWKDEFFRLGKDWADCHSASTPTRYLIEDLMDTWYLVNIVHNDFRQKHAIFELFDGLVVPDIDRPLHEVRDPATTNGASTAPADVHK